jgi:hypothetical protein
VRLGAFFFPIVCVWALSFFPIVRLALTRVWFFSLDFDPFFFFFFFLLLFPSRVFFLYLLFLKIYLYLVLSVHAWSHASKSSLLTCNVCVGGGCKVVGLAY